MFCSSHRQRALRGLAAGVLRQSRFRSRLPTASSHESTALTRAAKPQPIGADEKSRFPCRTHLDCSRAPDINSAGLRHKYREKFGHWPAAPSAGDVEPIEPSEATRSWVRSRINAYAKALQRDAAQ